MRYDSVDQPAGALSGGNAQKVILAREIDPAATLIVAAQPTRGLDIAATQFVWTALREARARGAGVLVISSDLDELFDVSDRVVVFVSGRIAAEFAPPYDLRRVGAAMSAAQRMNSKLFAFVRALAYVVLALVLCSGIFACAGYAPGAMFAAIADGALLSPHGAVHTLRWAMPLFVTALGVLIAFRCGYFNIGAQGQFYCGSIAAAFTADALHAAPAWLVIPLAWLAGIAGGALWALWPGVLRARWGTDEVITTLMGNFIAALALSYAASGPLKDASGTGEVAAGRPIAAAFRISTSSGVSWTMFAIVAVAGVLAWLLVERTAFGVLGSLAGRNPVMVVWQGARSGRIALAAFLFSGALAGLAGALELLGPSGRLLSSFAPTLGFSAILIALVAGLAVPAAALVALFFGGLAAASLYLPVIAGLPAAAIDIINAAITLFITARAWPRVVRRVRA